MTTPTGAQVVITPAGGGAASVVVTPGGLPGPAGPGVDVLTTLGDMVYENSVPTAARLPGNTASTKNFLTSTGIGGTAQAPAWGTISAGDVPVLNQATTATAGNVTGVVEVVNGGTGSNSRVWAGLFTPTLQGTAYSAGPGDYVRADISGGSWTMTLPGTPAASTVIGAKIINNAAGDVNALTVACSGSDVFNKSGGGTASVLTLTGQAAEWQYNSGIWLTQNTDGASTELAEVRQGTWYLDQFTGTDDQKMASALSAVWAASPQGGTIVLSARTHTFASQWLTSWQSGVIVHLAIRGAGSNANPNSTPSDTGVTSVNFTYAGGGWACASFNHQGSVDVSGIQFCSANAGVPFLYVGYTSLSCHDNSFLGGGAGATCVTDGIILGNAAEGFQGYHTVIWNNFFDGCRTLVSFGPYANGVRVTHNTSSATCGNAANYGAPFLLKGGGTSGTATEGNQIAYNLIEMVHYQAVAYAPANAYALNNQIGPNTTWDSGTFVPFAAADATSTNNYVDTLSVPGVWAPALDPSQTFTHLGSPAQLSTLTQSVFRYQMNFGVPPVVRSGTTGSAGVLAENAYGGRVTLAAQGTSTAGYPTGAQVWAYYPTQTSDGTTLNGAPYVSSPTMAFTLTDVGAYIQSVGASGIPTGTRVVWAYTHSSFGIAWQASTAYALGQPVLPVTHNSHLYWATTAGTSGSTQPAWPTGGGTVTDGSVVWTDLGTAATVAYLSGNCAASVAGTLPLSLGRQGTQQQMTTFLNHHVLGSGGAPSWTATGAGSGYTATATGSDLGQVLTLTTGNGSGAGIVLTGTAANTLDGAAGTFAVTAGNAAAAGLMTASAGAPYIALRSGSTGWTLTIPGTPADSTAYVFHILTLG